jgi:hypothetical protein
MFGRRRSETSRPVDAESLDQETPRRANPEYSPLEAVYPMQKVNVRWHTLDGGEVSVPGQLQSVDGEMVDVWINRHAPSFNPKKSHPDDRVWIDAPSGNHTYVFGGWLIGMRSPDTLVVMVNGLPRRDQRRQYVREMVDLPAQSFEMMGPDDEPTGPVYETVVHDLSGGGVRLEMSHQVQKDEVLLLHIDLGHVTFDAVVTVVDVFQTINGRKFVRGSFLEIEERFRREVIRFVFREQIRKARLTPP